MNNKIRLGCVNFLNGLPLIYPLQAGLLPHPFEISLDVPSVLVEKLSKGELDIALASSAALMRLGQDYSYIPGIGICSDGPVHSVMIYYNGEISSLKCVYTDPSSVTGNLLARIILDKAYGIQPKFPPHEKAPKKRDTLKEGEGRVLIGDRALRAHFGTHQCFDLGIAWKELTGLPFIYALWIGRREFITDEARVPLYNAYLMGRLMIPDIVASHEKLPLQPEAAISYLEDYIIHEVTEEAENGLSYFIKLAGEYS
jgi:chorismate dehydratase